ncbi:MAG TPA: asparagine synthase (glutamine-hydrolyzing) [Longimicrobiales bacterium]
MCGFAGIVSTRGYERTGLETAVRRMIAPIAHRGPDDEGVWADAEAGVALGFRRLAILDLSANGHQPMRSPSGRYTLVFNGEVYNHLALRSELEGAGFRFRGHSDTETILAAFEHWGVEPAVHRFIGMFAMAVWDASTREILLLRDRLGIKPLYISWRPGLLTFGSELKSLVEGPDFDRQLDTAALAAYLRYLYVPAPRTIYAHASKLPPGHILAVRSVDEPLPPSRPYWSLFDAATRGRAAPFRGTEMEALEEFEALLTDSVRLRLLSDVPLGTLLSGGIDSSTVTAVAQSLSSRPVKTFSIGFDHPDYDEAPAAARIAAHLGTDHTQLVLTDEDARAVVPRLPDIFDEPHADPSQIPTFLVSQLARRSVTVALSGDGGDEVFAGYHRYIQGEQAIGGLQRMPRPLRRVVAAGIGRVSSRSWDRLYRSVSPVLPATARHRLPGEKIVKIGALMRWDSPPEMYRSLLSAWQQPGRILRCGESQPSPVDQAFEAGAELPLLERMMLTDQAMYLPDDLLAKVDRASMAVSLEVRVPLLDHRIIEFSWRLPRNFKIRGRQGKWLLRQALYRRVPQELVDRPKMGFSVPIATWLRGALRPWAEDLLDRDALDRDGIFRGASVHRAWAALQRGHDELAIGLWAVLMFQAWRYRWLA